MSTINQWIFINIEIIVFNEYMIQVSQIDLSFCTRRYGYSFNAISHHPKDFFITVDLVYG